MYMQESVCVWVIDGSFLEAKSEASSNNCYSNLGNLIHHIAVSDAVLVSRFDFEQKAAQINAIGVVKKIDIEQEKVIMDLNPCNFLITPGANGRRHWQKPFFALNADRAYHYEVLKYFADILNDPEWLDLKLKDRSSNHYSSGRKPSLHVEEGYVYIWRYKNEYKIGKAVDIERRKKQVTNKTGRNTEEIHRIFSSDYSRAEALLHKRFQEKRLYGEAGIEWFLLDPEDVEWLKSITVFEDIEDEIS